MDKSHGNCECCEKWYKKHIVLKRKLAETSLQIGRFLQLDQENKKLKDKLRDMHELSQTLRADCAGYQKDMCATLAELNSLKQLSSSQCAELARLNQERDEAYQAHQVAQTSLLSCQAALRQYEALIQQQQEEAKSKVRPRSKTQENRVSVLEKKLQAYTQQVKQARSQRKKAMGWLRGFVELLGHPESWTSAKLRLQVERLSTLVHAEESPDEDLQCGARQLEAFLESYATSTKELTGEDLITKAREMQVPNPLSPLPPSPQSDWMLVPDPVPFVSSYSTLLSTSSEPEPPTPWLELSPSAVPSDHMLPAPSSEQMQLECASEVVPTAPMYNVNTLTPLSELVPPPVLPTVTHNTASEVKLLDSVSLVPHLEPLQQACLSKPVLLGPSLEPLLLTSSSDGIPPATPSTSTPLSSMSDPARLTQHSESAPPPLLESESTPVTAISEPASPTSSFGQEPTSVTALSELASPASSLKPEPTSVIVLSEPASPAPSSEPEPTSAPPAPSLKPEPASMIVLSEPALSAASLELEPMSAPAASSLKPEPRSVIALPEPAPHASSLEPEPTSTIFQSELALSASPLEPEPTSVIALPEPAPPASSKSEPALAPAASPLEAEVTSMITLSGPVPLVSSLGPEPTSVLALSELAPLAFSLKPEATLASPVISSEQEPTSLIALSEAAPPASLELEPTSLTALSKLTSPGSSLKPEPASMIALSELIPPASSVEQETTAVVSVSELAPPVCLLRPVMPVPSPVLAIASSSSDLAPTAPLSKPVVITPSLELGRQVSAAIPAELLQQSKLGLPLPLLEPVSLTPTEPKLPTLTSEPAYKGLKSLANHSKSSHVVGTTNNKLLKRSSGLEQHLCVQQMEERQAGREQQRCISRIGGAGAVTRLSEEQSAGPNMKACKPLTDRSNVQHERLALEGEPPLEAVQKVAKGMDTGLSLCPMREQQSSPEEELLVHEGQHAPIPCSTQRQQEQELESMVEVLPKRKQWLARKRQPPDLLSASERKRALHGTGVDQQLMNPQLKQGGHEQEQPQDSKKRLADVQDHAPTGKKPRLSKRQLRELFSSSSEEDEASVAEESAYTTFLLSAEHTVLSRTASGRLLAAKTAHTAMSKLSWLAVQPEVRPGVVASFVRNVKRDALIYAALLYLGRCKANPVAAYCRGEQAPPLITKLEMLLIEALALKPDGFAALLSSLRARLWSPRRPTRMLAQASYVRLLCAVCSQLKEHKVARVAIWDLLCSDHAPFLVASAVGAWPGLLSALPPGPLRRAVSYILLHSPAHSLNSTLMSQAHKVLCELGPLEEFVGDEQTLVNELLGPLLPPHRRCGDVCMTHRLALEQLCRRSPVDLLAWLLEQRLGPHLQSVLDQPHAACLVRLLGSLWKHYEKAAIKLENLLSRLESFLCHGEPAMQEAIVQALLLLPGLKGSRSAGALMHWQQQQPS
ncbi:mediator of DNA damage checkpoint protein 1-like isoform X4 [Dermacentor albipictus]|uniref:mediator of DNA damage checkpoint protein 1-like isoform X4 n=1 Tax=Dermacentor albipictus TaxID=60249 RepID=UPI0038FC7665